MVGTIMPASSVAVVVDLVVVVVRLLEVEVEVVALPTIDRGVEVVHSVDVRATK